MTTLRKNADFLEHAYHTVWMAAGASEEHAAVVARSDRYVRAVKSARRLPGVDEILLPGERGLRAAAGSDAIEIHEHHWKTFSDHATRYGIDLEQLHENWRPS